MTPPELFNDSNFEESFQVFTIWFRSKDIFEKGLMILPDPKFRQDLFSFFRAMNEFYENKLVFFVSVRVELVLLRAKEFLSLDLQRFGNLVVFRIFLII